MHAMEWILLEEKILQEKSGNEGLRIQHAQSANGEKKVPYRDKKSRQHHYCLDAYFVNTCGHKHAYDINMPMNLMDAGIMDAHTVSQEIGRHFTFKGKIFSNIT